MTQRRRPPWGLPVAVLASVAVACGSVPSETSPPPAGNEIQPAGVVEGTVVYNGPPPCSSNGHIVGAAVVFLFDRRTPPPPNGLATTPVNFGIVTGDVLFASEPRYQGTDTYCPLDHGVAGTVTASAPFAVSPLTGGSYLVESFYDYAGDFLPTFKFRELPERGDVAGGDLDTVAALQAINANPDYQPQFIPVDVGIPQGPLDAGPNAVPVFTIPDQGFVASNVTLSLGSVLATTRPYFAPAGLSVTFDSSAPGTLTSSQVQTSAALPTSQAGIAGTAETNPQYEPVLTIPQDIQVLAPPEQGNTASALNNLEASYPHLLLQGGLPSAEVPAAIAQPFHFQLSPSASPSATFNVWQNATFDAQAQLWKPQQTPEGLGIPSLWPLVVLTKLVDDPTHTLDPASLDMQGSATAPVVVLQAITLLGGDGVPGDGAGDSLANTITPATPIFDMATGQPVVAQQDHVTVMLRPTVICFDTLFDPAVSDKRGTLVTPVLLGTSADLPAGIPAPVVSPTALSSPQLAAQVKGSPVQACLPTGRYAINAVYPDGQAWTVPNESGACSGAEGATDYAQLTCTLQPRPVLPSQGTRAVVEIVAATDASHCAGSHAVPAACLPGQ
jgi:hypothetical protein